MVKTIGAQPATTVQIQLLLPPYLTGAGVEKPLLFSDFQRNRRHDRAFVGSQVDVAGETCVHEGILSYSGKNDSREG